MPRFDENKTLAVILYFANKTTSSIGVYKLVKMIYSADKLHLQRWGRLITGDNYARMPLGPAPSAAYNMIKSVRGEYEWERDLSIYFHATKYQVYPHQKPDMDEFSESEIQIMDEVFNIFKSMSFDQVKKACHYDDVAYNCSNDYWMSLEDLSEGDRDLIHHIRKARDDEESLG